MNLMSSSPKSVDIIVPEFNELTREGEKRFDSQLAYLSRLAEDFNVILVDDCSQDGSWQRIAKLARRLNPRLHLIRMKRNGRKVLAVKKAVQGSDADYVILSDFDSRLVNPQRVPHAVRRLVKDASLAGMAFKLVPEGSSLFSKLQDLEYAMTHAIMRYLDGQKKVRCVPGAAGIWDRKVLLQVLEEHSGRHNGDDLESTAIAIRKGYRTSYEPSIVVQTIVPQSPSELFRQRRRWELGALETYGKERRFFLKQIWSLRNRLGHVTIFDWYLWSTVLLTPMFIVNWILNPMVGGIYFLSEMVVESCIGFVARKEMASKKEFILIPIFPFYRLFATAPRIGAIIQFAKSTLYRGTKSLTPYRVDSFPALEKLGVQDVAMLQKIASRIS